MALMRKLPIPHLTSVNGREALDTYRANPSSFLLILCDMSMPIMDGFTATAKIRETERNRRLPRCPIAALTGVTSEDAKRRAFASGVDELFSKPVHMAEVKELMERVRRSEVGGER
jgi:CheY-like chemotaxis protein